MTVDFQNHFWGDKQTGFEALYQNLKCGSAAVKELSEFFRSRSFLEEYNVNFLTKLSRKTNNPQLGSFQPLLLILKSSTEKLSSVHTQTLQRLNQLIKEINKYCDEHHRKQKHIKNEEIATIEAINELKETVTALNKAKEFYHSKAAEVDRLGRENASQKDIEKAETRVKKACIEYKSLIEKYRKAKEDFERKFCVSCQNFQRLEEDHINQMRGYLNNYSEILENGHLLIGQVYQEFRKNCDDMTTEKLLDAFVQSKGTGSTRPAVIQFEEASGGNTISTMPNTNLANLISSSSTITNTFNNNNNLKNYSSALDILNLDLTQQQSSSSSNNNHVANPMMTVDLDSKVDNIDHLLTAVTNNNNRKEGINDDRSVKSLVGADGELTADSKMTYSTVNSLDNFYNQSRYSVNVDKDHHKSFPDIPSNTKTPKWFLRNRNKDKKNKKKDSDDESNASGLPSISGSRGDSLDQMNDPGPVIDSEGYSIRPDTAVNKDDSYFSSSDSDDSDAGEKEKKIFVKINPLPNNSQTMSTSNVDQLIASATALTLAPTNHLSSRRLNSGTNPSPTTATISEGGIQRSSSVSHTAFKAKKSELVDLFGSDQSGGKVVTMPGSNSSAFDSIKSVNNKTNETSSTSSKSVMRNVDRYAAFTELSASAKSDSSIPSGGVTETENRSTTANVLPLPPKSSASTENTSNIGNTTVLSKSISSTSFGGTNSFSVYKPMMKPMMSATSVTNINAPQNGMMSRTESIISLSSDFRMTPISLCSSRDSSPLTISMSDTIPVALAFQESVSCCIKGLDENLTRVNLIGCIKMAFSAGIIQVLTANPYLPQLTFKLKNTNRLEKIILSKDLIEQVDSNDEFCTYEMNSNALQSSIKRLHEQAPNARYYNLDIVKYQVSPRYGAKHAPLQLVSYWKCEPNQTNLKIDFKYNPLAFKYGTPQPLRNVQFTANIDSEVISMVSQPQGKWDSLTKQAIWKYNEISQTTESGGLGSIKAKFDLAHGPCCPSSVNVQFACHETVMSGLDFELIGTGYRLSLVKRQFSAGRYYCEPKIAKKPVVPVVQSSPSSSS